MYSHSYLKDYKSLRLLGEGGFGKVYEVEHKVSKLRRAVKEIEKSKAAATQEERDKFIQEVDILARLDHPNVIKIYELYEDEYKYCVVSELVQGGELFDYIMRQEKLSESFAATIMSQVLSAVFYLHEHHIVHRDLKPENILLEKDPTDIDDLNVKIIDFGTSVVVQQKKGLRETIGTMYYMAPDVLNHSYNEKCDVWSVGVILFILLVGYPPFGGETDEEITDNILRNKPIYDSPQWSQISPESKAFVKRMLTTNPAERLSAHEALQDPWMVKFSKKRVGEAEAFLAVNDLKRFRGDIKLKQAVSTFITTQLLSKEETQYLRDVFSSIDVNHDGLLSKEEMLEGLSKKMPLEEAKAEVDRIMEQVDIDKSGHIDYTEFISASASLGKQMSASVLERAFRMIDADGSGKIGISELQSLLGKGVIAEEEVWKNLLHQADKDEDGEIDIKEFTAMMLATYA